MRRAQPREQQPTVYAVLGHERRDRPVSRALHPGAWMGKLQSFRAVEKQLAATQVFNNWLSHNPTIIPILVSSIMYHILHTYYNK